MADEFDDMNFDDIDSIMAEGDDFGDMGDAGDDGSPVSRLDLIKDSVDSATEIDVLGNKFKNTMLDALPGTVGSDVDKMESGIDKLTETYDKSMKPLRKAASSTLGGLAEVLPDFMGDSVRSIKEWVDEDIESSSSERELTDDEKAQAEVEGILVKSALETQVNDKIANIQSKKDSELLSMIAEATTKISIYKSDYDSNYYKRSLELQLKQVMTTVKLYDLLKTDSEKRNLQFEALVKNTSLPDFAKSRTSDHLKEMGLGVMKDTVSSAFTKNSAIENVTKFGKEKITNALATAADGLGMLDGGVEAVQMATENGMDPLSILLDEVIGGAVDRGIKLTTKVSTKALFDKFGGAKILGDYETFSADPQKAIENLKTEHIGRGGDESDLTYKTLDLANEAIGAAYTTNDAKIGNVSDMREAAMIDNKFKKTVDTVIPGFLAKILNELTTIRKSAAGMVGGSGSSSNGQRGPKATTRVSNYSSNSGISSDEELVFDFTKNKFVNKKDVKQEISKKLDKHVSSLVDSIISNNIDSYLIPEHLSIKDRTEVAIATAKYLLDGKSLAPKFMLSDGLDKYIKDNEPLKKKLKRGLTKLSTNENISEDDLKDRIALNTKLKSIKSSIGKGADIADYADLNNSQEILQEMGITDAESPDSIKFSSMKKKYDGRLAKVAEGKVKETKLTKTEQDKIDKAKEKLEKIKETNNKALDKLRKEKARKEKEYKDSDPAKKGFNAGYSNYNSTESERNTIIAEDTKDMSAEDTLTYTQTFTIGTVEGLKQVDVEKKLKEAREELAKKTKKGLRSSYKKLTPEDAKNLDDRIAKDVSLEEIKNIGSFNVGGFTLIGRNGEIGGIVHKNEYVLSPEKIKELVANIKSGNPMKLVDFSTNIVKDISKHDNNFAIDKTKTEKLTDGLKFIKTGSSSAVDSVKTKAVDLIGANNIETGKAKVTKLKDETKSYLKDNGFDVDSYINKAGELTKEGRGKLDEFYKEHKEVLDPIKVFGTETGRQAKEALKSAGNKASKIVSNIPTNMDDAKKLRDDITNSVTDLSKSLTSTLDDVAKNIPNSLQGATDSVFGLGSSLSGGIKSISDSASETFSVQISAMKNLSDSIFAQGTLLGGMKDSITTVVDKQLTATKEFVNKNTEDIVAELDKKGVFKRDSDGNITGISVDSTKGFIKEKVKDISTDKDGNDNFLGKVMSKTASMAANGANSVKAILGKTIDVTPELLDDLKSMEDVINKNGTDALMKHYLASRPLPTNELAANALYRSMFITMDPTGQMWEKTTTLPNYLKELEQLHVMAIEEGQKGLLTKAIEGGGTLIGAGLDKGKSFLGGMKEKMINSLPPSLQGPARKLLDSVVDNPIVNKLKRTGGRIKNIAKGALGTVRDEMRIIGQEGKQLFINDDGKLQMPNLLKLGKFAGKSYVRSMKAVGGGVRELYKGVGAEALDVGKIAGKAAWKFTGGGVIEGLRKVGAKQWAKLKPPIRRELYNAWVDGSLTAKEVTKALDTDEEKEAWHDWLKKNTKRGITLPDLLLNSGEFFFKSMVGTGKSARKGYGVTGKIVSAGAKLFAKGAAEFSGLNDIKRAVSKKLTTPDIDPELFEAWKRGELKAKQVTEALQDQDDKDKWTEWLIGSTTKHRSLPKLLEMSGKWFAKSMNSTGAVVNTSYKSGFKASSVVGGLAAKAAYVTSGLDDLFNSGEKLNKGFKTLLDIIPENMRNDVTEDISKVAEELSFTMEDIQPLNEDVNKLNRKHKQKLARKITELVTLYVANEDGSLSEAILADTRNLLLYIKSITDKDFSYKPNKANVKVKPSDIKEDASKVSKNDADVVPDKEFFKGGYTGDGRRRDKAGIVHKLEYVINPGMLKKLMSFFSKGDDAGKESTMQAIFKDVTTKSTIFKGKYSTNNGDSVIKSVVKSDGTEIRLLKEIADNTYGILTKPTLGSKIASSLGSAKDSVVDTVRDAKNNVVTGTTMYYNDAKDYTGRVIDSISEDANKIYTNTSETISGAYDGTKQYVGGAVTAGKDYVKNDWQETKDNFNKRKDFVKENATKAKTTLIKGAKDIGEFSSKAIVTALTNIGDALTASTRALMGGIGGMVGFAGKLVNNGYNTLKDGYIGKQFSAGKEFLKDDWQKTKDNFNKRKEYIGGKITAGKQKVIDLGETAYLRSLMLKDSVSAGYRNSKNYITDKITAGKEKLTNVKNSILNAPTALKNKAMEKVNAGKDYVKGKYNKAKDFVKDKYTKAKKAIGTTVSAIGTGIKSVGKNIFKGVKALASANTKRRINKAIFNMDKNIASLTDKHSSKNNNATMVNSTKDNPIITKISDVLKPSNNISYLPSIFKPKPVNSLKYTKDDYKRPVKEELEKAVIKNAESKDKTVKLLEQLVENTEVKKEGKTKSTTSLTRAGNREAVLEKMYGKKKTEDKGNVTIIKEASKDKDSLLSKLMMFAPLLLGGIKTLIGDNLVKPLKSALKFLGSSLLSGISGALGTVGSLVMKGLSTVKDQAFSLASKAGSFITDKVTKLVPKSVSKAASSAKSFLGNMWSGAKDLAGRGINAVKKLMPKLPIRKVKALWKLVKKKVFKKLGMKAGAKVVGKTLAKFVPGVGTAILAYDASKIAYEHFSNKVPLKNAVSEQFLGFDIFGKDDVAIGPDGKPIKPDDELLENSKVKPPTDDKITTPVNNVNYKPGGDNANSQPKAEGSWLSRLKSKVTSMFSSDKPTKKLDVETDSIRVPVDAIVNDLKRDEGVVLHKYKDSLGYDTIGVGHLLDKNKGGKSLRDILGVDKDKITEDESDAILVSDVNTTSKELYKKVPWLDTQPENVQKSLLNMAFNLGVGGLLKFKKALKHLQNMDYKGAAAEFYNSTWRKQVGKRAGRLIADISSTPTTDLNNPKVSNVSASSFDKQKPKVNIGNSKSKPTIDKKKIANSSNIKTDTKVKVNMGSIDESKHLNDMSHSSRSTLDTLNKSLKVQTGLYNKMDELVELQKEQLKLMTNGGSGHRRPANNKFVIDDNKEHMSHSTANF